MTPYQMAKKECANCEADGLCLGISIDDDLTLGQFSSSNAACQLKVGKRCSYFETTVLPTADISTDPVRAKAFNEARCIYTKKALKSEGIKTKNVSDFIPAITDLCPDCEERPRMRGGIRCPVCAKKQAKSKARERKSKQRRNNGVS